VVVNATENLVEPRGIEPLTSTMPWKIGKQDRAYRLVRKAKLHIG
jgi:hypothetical protein